MVRGGSGFQYRKFFSTAMNRPSLEASLLPACLTGPLKRAISPTGWPVRYSAHSLPSVYSTLGEQLQLLPLVSVVLVVERVGIGGLAGSLDLDEPNWRPGHVDLVVGSGMQIAESDLAVEDGRKAKRFGDAANQRLSGTAELVLGVPRSEKARLDLSAELGDRGGDRGLESSGSERTTHANVPPTRVVPANPDQHEHKG
jgi:hypothetical protein